MSKNYDNPLIAPSTFIVEWSGLASYAHFGSVLPKCTK
jgi:hypothetical protein